MERNQHKSRDRAEVYSLRRAQVLPPSALDHSWLSDVRTCMLRLPATISITLPEAASPSFTVSQFMPASREWITVAWLPPAHTSFPCALTAVNSTPDAAAGEASSHVNWSLDLRSFPPATAQCIGASSLAAKAVAPEENAGDVSSVPASDFSGALATSAERPLSSVGKTADPSIALVPNVLERIDGLIGVLIKAEVAPFMATLHHGHNGS